MERILLLIILLSIGCIPNAKGQIVKQVKNQIKKENFNPGYNSTDNQFDEASHIDSIGSRAEEVPESIYVWNLDTRFCEIKPADIDTLQYLFQNKASTAGLRGKYNYTGNLGAPRMSRILSDNFRTAFENQFIFRYPYDYFVKPIEDHQFTNTRSPFTNITYHECGDKEHGEDRILASFATNAGKNLGLGFVIDYLYGRGYYQSQNTAHFKSSLYASYVNKKYVAHFLYQLHYLKNSENGGLENDLYISEPESFSTTYETWDMPTNLKKTWNKLNINELLFTQRFNWGHDDEDFQKDSIFAMNDSLHTDTLIRPIKNKPPFSVIHALKLSSNDRLFLSNFRTNNAAPLYFSDYFLPGDSAKDITENLNIKNTLAIELREGSKKWFKTGVRFFVAHEFQRYSLPVSKFLTEKYHYNYIHVGANFLNVKSKYFNFNLLGELRTCDGKKWGEFNIEAYEKFKTKIKNDSLVINFSGQILNESPSFYFKHYHARNAWWDNNDFKNQTFFRIGADVHYKGWNLRINLEQINNVAYFQERLDETTITSSAPNSYLHSVKSVQNGKPIQRLEFTLKNHFKYGIFNWENELSYQTSSNQSTLPLPLLNVYSNVFIKFKIAKVLNTELGVDAIYFTKYAPMVYSPIIGNYVVQDQEHSQKIGNYPVIGAYANFHLKRTRFYINATHLNSTNSDKSFHLPHMPMNPMVIKIGISWNFIN